MAIDLRYTALLNVVSCTHIIWTVSARLCEVCCCIC